MERRVEFTATKVLDLDWGLLSVVQTVAKSISLDDIA